MVALVDEALNLQMKVFIEVFVDEFAAIFKSFKINANDSEMRMVA
ncbi:hypothetical protein HOT32_gp29 [Erwinia phage Faunus]|uniref:Uncharacterized protein n=1 Tax=Erwinia phage Faunus TaxID=2182346 RepID=A0A2U8UWH8_9CAUD|nr:hypothetical protein HOT32_gp29 [Erwinia phage Faunus]AWN08612.1 hypothetical protein [Erwinia phage Faunus]